MKKSLRAFGVGVFLVGAVLTVSNFGKTATFSSSNSDENAQKEIAALEKQLALANAEIAKLKNAESIDRATSNSQTANATENTSSSSKQEDNKNFKTGTIIIYEGMTLYDIGKQVEDTGVLENGRELELFLSKPEYSRSIQKGQFELDSNMTLEQMSRIITGKKVTQ
ncbi:hypothetical protein [Solibacillus sp. CAU 1738]|uniref:hypothetical protein n=1 Tax=Solibacillus sp. CAU 1738 TaxID=3140363 RepID=UPI0032603125